LLDPSALLIAMALDIVGVSRASLPALGPVTRLQLEIAQLSRVQRRLGPRIAFALAQQMPDDHRELAGGRDSGDMLTAAGAYSKEERTQRTRRSRRRPSRLDEHAARMPTALLGDPAVIRGPRTRLAHTRVEAKVAHQLLRLLEASHVTDCGHDGERHHHVDPRDCRQAFDTLVP
jgi:hypothetical protein